MVIGVIILAVLFVLLLTCWRRVKADKGMVITGLKQRVLTGKGGLVIPILETTCTISLEAISMTTDVTEAPSKQGIFVDVVGTAVVKVKNDTESIIKAVERFCTGGVDDTVGNIQSIVEKILEGKLRGIVSTLTVEQINEDRASFEQSIEDNIRTELGSMGLELISYSILKIATQGGYLENRAKPQIARAKADADIAESERKRDTEIKTAEARREGEKAKLESDTAIAEAQRDKKLKTEKYRAEEEQAKAEADVAYEIKQAEKQQLVEEQNIKLAEKKAEVKEKQLIIDVEKPAEAQKKKLIIESQAEKEKAVIDAQASKEKAILDAQARAEAVKLQAQAEAEAMKIKAQAVAEAKRVEAEAEAKAIEVRGNAEADVIKAKAVAEAEGTEKLAQAMEKFGDAAVLKMALDKLPEITKSVASSMEQIDNITIIDNGSGSCGASKLTNTVAKVASEGFQVIKDLTGLDITEALKSRMADGADVDNKSLLGDIASAFESDSNRDEEVTEDK